MRKLRENVFLSDDDEEVLSIIKEYKARGVKIPEFDTAKSFMFPIVGYSTGFNLTLISYISSNDSDKGFVLLSIENFLSENKFNVQIVEPFGFDYIRLLSGILEQVQTLAVQINYPFTISTLMDKDFTGLIATPHHPIDEITNQSGHKN